MTRSRIAVVIITIVTITVALWINIPNLIGLLITAALKDMGATHISIKVSEVSWQQGHIQHLRFYKTLSQRELQVDARNLSIQYSLAGLINGQIEDLKLPETTMIVTPEVVSSNDKSGFKPPDLFLPDVALLPVNKLWINNLIIIHQHIDNPQAQVHISGFFEKQFDAINGQLVIQQQGQQDLQVNLGMHQQLMKLDIGYDINTPWINVSVEEIDSKSPPELLQLKSRIDLAKFTQLIKAWGYAENLTGVTGDFQLQMQWPLMSSNAAAQGLKQDEFRANVQAKLKFSIDQWQGYASDIVANLDWRATMTKDSMQWKLSENSLLRSQPDIKAISDNNTMLQQILAGQQPRLHIGFPGGLSGTLAFDRASSFMINEAIRFHYQDKASKPLLRGTLNALSVQLQPEWNIQARFTTQLNLLKTGIPTVQSVHAEMAGHVSVLPQILALSVDKQATATVVPAKQSAFVLAPVQIKLTEGADCRLNTESKLAQCKQLAVAITGLKYSQGDVYVAADSATLRLNDTQLIDGQLNFTADTVVKNINAANTEYAVDFGQLKTHIVKTASKLRLNGELLTLDGDIKTQYAIDHYLANGKGLLAFELLPIDFAKQKQISSRLLRKGLMPVKLLSGTLSSHGRIKWEPIKVSKNKFSNELRLSKQIHIALDNLAGSYQKAGFIGLQSEINLAGIDTLTTTEPVRLQLNKLDAGLEISDIQLNADLQFKQAGIPVMDIHTLNAKVLGGEINGKFIKIDLERSHNPFVLEVNRLDLSKLLAWQQVEGISGTGLLDVRLPFDLTDKGLIMKEGQITALSPGGELHYVPDERVKKMAQTNSNIKMLLDALNSFIYSDLTAKSNYSSDGKLVLDVALKGKSPEFQQGRAVNLNINIEENLLKLLKSLQVGEEIGKKIADQLQQQK